MKLQNTTTLEDVIEHLGFNPYHDRPEVVACASIGKGPRRGYWLVFTTQTGLISELYQHDNFVDVSRGPAPGLADTVGIVYTFRSIHHEKLRRAA